jgi:hypothetical protein
MIHGEEPVAVLKNQHITKFKGSLCYLKPSFSLTLPNTIDA